MRPACLGAALKANPLPGWTACQSENGNHVEGYIRVVLTSVSASGLTWYYNINHVVVQHNNFVLQSNDILPQINMCVLPAISL